MVVITKGDFIWIEPTASITSPNSAYAVPIGARVLHAASHSADRILVVDDEGNERKLGAEKRIRVMHPTSIQGVEDMTQLVDLHDAALLRNLHIRFCEKLIYSYVGSILIAVNPYKWLPIYGVEQIHAYRMHAAADLPPHIYALANKALCRTRGGNALDVSGDQCIVLSGESGAGKSECARQILDYITSVCETEANPAAKPLLSSNIEQKIMDAIAIFNVFGNARTLRNANSSRCGMFVDLHFNARTGQLESARIEPFMLEKSRLVRLVGGERNFHIFYTILDGLSPAEKFELELGHHKEYHILEQGSENCSGDPHYVNDTPSAHSSLAMIRAAMKALMFKEAEFQSILKIIAAILHVGNMKYKVDTSVEETREEEAGDDSGVPVESIDVCDQLNAGRVAKLLQINVSTLIDALRYRTVVVRGECIVTTMDAEQALDVRDAFIRGVYGHLFDYVLRRVNDAIYRPVSAEKPQVSPVEEESAAAQRGKTKKPKSAADALTKPRLALGVLDIFGFESVSSATFEQLCINYAAEQIQQFFIRQTFKLEQAEYEAQHIEWRWIDCSTFDNLPVLDLLSVHSTNVMSLIDDESIYPQASDTTLLEKLHSNHAHNEALYVRPKSELSRSFTINHYMEPVTYNVKGFLDRNRDTFSADLQALMQSSRFKFFRRLFEQPERRSGGYGVCNNTLDGKDSRIRQTAGLRFRRSLESLMLQLETREAHFVVCVKPTEHKRPMHFDRQYVMKQLRCTGMLETTEIKRACYPIRHDYARFVNRYRVFLPGTPAANKVDCVQASRHICAIVFGKNADYQFGKTKLFLKEDQGASIEQELEKMLVHYALVIQKSTRRWMQRQRFLRLRAAVIVLQKNWRACAQKAKYRKILLGIARLQATFRSQQLVRHYNQLRGTVIEFQAACRGAIIRNVLRCACTRADRKTAMIALAKENSVAAVPLCHFAEENINGCLTLALDSQRPEDFVNVGRKAAKDYTPYKFGKFAVTYFQQQETPTFMRKALRQPLLQHDNNADRTASLALWVAIMRFMRDVPERAAARKSDAARNSRESNHSLMSRMHALFGRGTPACSQSDYRKIVDAVGEFDAAHGLRKSMFGVEQFSQMDRSRRDVSSQSEAYVDTNNNHVGAAPTDSSTCFNDTVVEQKENQNPKHQKKSSLRQFYTAFLLDDQSMQSGASLLQFIVGHGILNSKLRDEIYCQICKQLAANNPSVYSLHRGWLLLALCAGCFAPSSKLLKYFYCFLRENCPPHMDSYNAFVEERLRRTLLNGTRRQPPCEMEYQACKSMRLLPLCVKFMDGTVCTILADSAVTAGELCQQLATKIGLLPPHSQPQTEPNVVDGDAAEKNRQLERVVDAIFGFSLYITVLDKCSSLGAGADYVLDAIAQSEQLAAAAMGTETEIAWRLFFRKEIFTPWHNASENLIGTNLIYYQLIRGIHFGEYRCEKEEELALLCAQQYFVEHNGPRTINVETLEAELSEYLPNAQLVYKGGAGNLSVEKWLQLILNIFRKRYSEEKQPTLDSVKADVVTFGLNKWPLLFSRFCEAYKFAGPPLPTNEVVIAVNRAGVGILNAQDQPLVEFSFTEIVGVSCNVSKRVGADTVTLRIVNGDEYTFQSPNAQDVRDLVVFFIKGLQKRSKYLLAMRAVTNAKSFKGVNSSIKPDEHVELLECIKGDLLILSKPPATVLQPPQSAPGFLLYVENTRTGMHGFVPALSVYTLPTLTKPTVDVVEQFNRQRDETQHGGVHYLQQNLIGQHSGVSGGGAEFNGGAIMPFLPAPNPLMRGLMTPNAMFCRAHTLEQFAAENFYSSNGPLKQEFAESAIAVGVVEDEEGNVVKCSNGSSLVAGECGGATRSGVADLWRWSRELLRRPLLKRIGGVAEAPAFDSVLSYEYILKYMGDLPTHPPKYFLEFTDIIFRAPLKYQILRDETYCQLMKQLTDNPNPMSEERGWELMWLCLGLFPPSKGLQAEVNRFLRTRYLPIAADCAVRLQRIAKSGGTRKFPPHQVEVEAIQHRTTQIFHKVFLPDGSEEVIEVDSLTNARDFGARIVSRLRLKSGAGFSVFVKADEKVISMPENEYLFDFIHELADWMIHNRTAPAVTPMKALSPIFSYQLFFIRKLWINVSPGDDMNADLIFHYHQELPKYLRGYHSVTRQQAAHLSALVLRAQTRDDKQPPIQQFQHVVREILPHDMIKSCSMSEWKKLISAELERLGVRTSTEAKLEFLKYMREFPTFGSAFFEVKQTSDPTMATRVIVAINRNGLSLFNQDTKEFIVGHPFTAISHWTSGNTYFDLTLGSLGKVSRLLFETTLGYKMDDLLTSYIQMLLSSIDKNSKSAAKPPPKYSSEGGAYAFRNDYRKMEIA